MENRGAFMEKNMFEDIVAEGNIVVIDNYWIVLWRSYHNRNILGANSDEKAGGKTCPAG